MLSNLLGRLRKTFGPGVPTGRTDIRDAVTGELKGSEQSFRLLFDSNPIPMWLMDVEFAQNIRGQQCRCETLRLHPRKIPDHDGAGHSAAGGSR